MPTAVAARLMLTGYQRRGLAISASSEQTGFPATQLGSPRLSRGWRSVAGAVSAVDIDWDAGSSVEVKAVVLHGCNLTAAATRRVRLSDTAAGNTDKGDSTTQSAFNTTIPDALLGYTPPWGRTLIYLPDPSTTARYGRLTLNDSGSTDGYLAASLLVAEDGWQPGISFDESWERGTTPRGAEGSQVGIRGHKLVLHRITKNEGYQLERFCRTSLLTRRTLVIPRAKNPETWGDDVVWAVLRQMPSIQPIPKTAGRFYTATLVFDEVDE